MNQELSYWEKSFYDQADIVVIGAGLVGIQTAINLKSKMPKRKIWILDKHAPGKGANLRNAGFACFGNVGEIVDDAERMGMDEAINLYRTRYEGFQKLKETISEGRMGFEQSGGYEIFRTENGHHYEAALTKIDAINKGLFDLHQKNVFLPKPTAKLKINSYENGFYTPFEGTIQTHLLVHALRRKAQSLGIEFYEGLGVTKIEETVLDKHIIHTNTGNSIECKALVVCTNAWANDLLNNEDIKPARGQIIITSPLANLPWRGLLHCDKGYIYARSLGTRILIGGGRNLDFKNEETTEQETTESITNHLVSFINEVLAPDQEFTIDFKWAGIMGMSESRAPIVKEIEGGLYCGIRLGGMGVALSAEVSNQLAKLILEKYH